MNLTEINELIAAKLAGLPPYAPPDEAEGHVLSPHGGGSPTSSSPIITPSWLLPSTTVGPAVACPPYSIPSIIIGMLAACVVLAVFKTGKHKS